MFAPQDLRIADPAVADDMAAGLYTFGTRTVSVGIASPFEVAPPGRDWAAELYGFGWLRHLRAADTGPARSLARALVSDALVRHRRELEAGLAIEAPIAARRVMSILAHSPLLLEGADHAFYRRILRMIGRDAALLDRAMRDAPVPSHRLAAAIGLCVAGLACSRLERSFNRASQLLSTQLEIQILADGGHVGRNPATLIGLLLDILPLRLLYESRGVAVPAALDAAVDRMLPMVRFFRHGCGDLALFNGMGVTPIGELARILAHDTVGGTPVMHAVASGYDRLEAGRTVVIADTGAGPPPPSSAEAHAGFLAFELSSGTNRIVVNCGAPAESGPVREAARWTAAHSTLTIGSASSALILGADEPAPSSAASYLTGRLGPVMAAGPRTVGAESGRSGDDLVLSAYHDGYRDRFDATHTRRLRLTPDGRRLDGEDTLAFGSDEPDPRRPALLRFHLHPGVRPTLADDGVVTIASRDGERWRFAVRGGPVRLEESVLFAVSEGRRATTQIVVGPLSSSGERRISAFWRFERDGGG